MLLNTLYNMMSILVPRTFTPADRLAPVSTAVPADAQDAESAYTPSFAEEGVARLADVAEADFPREPAAASSSSHGDVRPEGAAPSAPPHPDDDKMLVELGDGIPFKDDVLKKEATSLKHLLTHYPNPFCPLCHIAEDTSIRVSHIKDGKSDDGIDPPKQPFQQLATDDVILAKGSEHFGTGIGGIKTHHVIRDLYSGARVAYLMSKRDVEAHAKNFRHYVGLRAGELATRTIIKMDEAHELEQAAHQVGFIPETSLLKRWPHNSMLARDIREEKECCRVAHLHPQLRSHMVCLVLLLFQVLLLVVLSYQKIISRSSEHSLCLLALWLVSLLEVEIIATSGVPRRRVSSRIPSQHCLSLRVPSTHNWVQQASSAISIMLDYAGNIWTGDENQCSCQIEESAKTAPPHLWSSIPCTSGSP